jgi:hypothetical protein
MSEDDGGLFYDPTHDVPHARTQDPYTSQLSSMATEQVEGVTSVFKPGSTKHLALQTLGQRPRTAIEVERVSGRRGIWKRVSDLKNANLIIALDARRDVLTKREGLVWTLNDRGRVVLNALDRGETVRL